ncbi:HTH-type transcriptional activator CmpR [Achromobacter insolitus]|uniref:LysR family transcriptional regulator n=1 Tax=Achromobacter insolitus TaxID=217204 RepID=UPI000972DD23|nr:LysR substrate-binding domain-containing protein [Achromobacter insolitus]APX74544.1 LysR family transcriptional regulator [Achromobacter insolitus]OWT60826.1 LysR family transcriptional regulator [Achromobacter insolitus]CAB3685224.1 Octopine catabolism/uptake operon regulatory protein OccR [Achromobacter insolitus]VEG68356.1 HTH-type transcriptional activator CmpR [Achromobacter insolitus]
MDAHAYADEVGPTAGRPLNLRQIEVFRAIMMAGSISGAGRMLHVSQPAVSRVLALTESRLGYKLFERVKSRLSPTAEARRLYAEVEQVYGGIQRVNDLAASLGQSGAGMLKIVASASFGQRLIPMALDRFRGRNADARVDYRSVTFDELAAYFLSGQADIGVSMQPPDHPNLRSMRLARVPVICVLPAGHPLAARDVIRPEDFSTAAWIGYPRDTPLARALKPFFGEGPACAAAVEVHSPVTACSFVQQGLGQALVDAWCVTPDQAAHMVLRPIWPQAGVDIWATHSNLSAPPLLARRFLAAVKKTLEEGAPPDMAEAPGASS